MTNPWKTTSQCFGCHYFKQYHPLTFQKPGECKWDPGPQPAWLQDWLDLNDNYYGPKRMVESQGYFAVTDCPTFKEKTDVAR